MMKKTAAMLTLATALGVAVGVIGSHTVGKQQESPYLRHPERLADVVAALQFMGPYKFDNNTPSEWEKGIGGPPKSAKSWSDVFKEHPEFFRISKEKLFEEKITLVWRRARERLYDTLNGNKMTQVDLKDWSEEQKKDRLSREPLSTEQTTAMIEIAIKMQTSAIARREELRWWVPVVVGVLGIFVGALLKS